MMALIQLIRKASLLKMPTQACGAVWPYVGHRRVSSYSNWGRSQVCSKHWDTFSQICNRQSFFQVCWDSIESMRIESLRIWKRIPILLQQLEVLKKVGVKEDRTDVHSAILCPFQYCYLHLFALFPGKHSVHQCCFLPRGLESFGSEGPYVTCSKQGIRFAKRNKASLKASRDLTSKGSWSSNIDLRIGLTSQWGALIWRNHPGATWAVNFHK